MAKATPARRKARRSVTVGVAHIKASFNNTLITITDSKGETLCWASAGTCGFKGSRKSTPFAGQMSAQQAADKAMKCGMKEVDVKVKGPGSGRESAITALQGAEIIFYPTAIGWHPSEKSICGAVQHDAWETIQRAHAVANGCYVAVCNRVGHEAPAGGDGLDFWGQSLVAGTQGKLLAKASADREEIVLAQVDLAKIDDTRTHWPFLRDRRIDAYADLTKRFIESPAPRRRRAKSQ